MKIAYLNRGPGVSGGQRIIHEHLERLHKRGHEVGLCFLNDAKTFWLEHSYPIVGLDWLEDADIVTATSWPTAPLLNSLDIPAKKFYLVQGRESLFMELSQVRYMSEAEWTYRLPLHIITIAPWIMRTLKDEYGRDVDFLPNGVNEAFNPDVTPHPREKERVLLVEGSAHSMAKDRLLMAGAVLAALPDDLRERTEVWLLTLDEAYAEALKDKVDKVFHLPPQADIPGIYAGADVMLKCSRFEGAPCPIVEAMACGCVPVVALEHNGTDYMGAGDINDGENGYIVRYGDVEEAVKFVSVLLENEGLRDDHAAAGGTDIQMLHNWDDIIARLEGIYQRALDGTTAWNTAQEAEWQWWVDYVKQELGGPTFSVFLGHRRQQLKDALRKFGFWRDQNYGDIPPGKWLDAGSGPVSMLHGLEWLQVDAYDPLMAEYAERLATVCGLGQRDTVTYRVGSMEGVEGEYDGCWTYNVLDHTADWRAALTHLCDVLKPGGQLWLMTHCRPPQRRDTHHTQTYSAADVLALLAEQGMTFEFVDTDIQVGTRLDELRVRAVKS